LRLHHHCEEAFEIGKIDLREVSSNLRKIEAGYVPHHRLDLVDQVFSANGGGFPVEPLIKAFARLRLSSRKNLLECARAGHADDELTDVHGFVESALNSLEFGVQ